MLCALLIFQKTDLEKPLTEYSPCIDTPMAPSAEVLAQLQAQTHRRFIKTHTPLDGLPYFKQAKYICVGRDPRDLFLSLVDHTANLRSEVLESVRKYATGDWRPPVNPPEDLLEWFCDWMSSSCSDKPGHEFYTDVLYYVRSFWQYRNLPNILMLHYNDLKTDLEGEMRRIADFLDIHIPEERWSALISAASFESMKGNAGQLAPQISDDVWVNHEKFFNKGKTGRWKNILDDNALNLYRQAMKSNLEPELANWLEKGRLAA